MEDDFDINKYNSFSEIKGKHIECIIELEEDFIALCSNEYIYIYKYDFINYSEYMVIKDNEENKSLFNLLYTKEKELISQSDHYLKIYKIFLDKKSYNLIQSIKLKEITTARVKELSNNKDLILGDITSQIIRLQKINENEIESNQYKVISLLNLGKYPIEEIIEINNKEICVSSTYDEIIAFFDIETFELIIKINHKVNGGSGALCMINENILLVIDVYGKEISLINISEHKLIKTFSFKEKIFLYALKISQNNIILAMQEEYKKLVESKQSSTGHAYIPYKKPTFINLIHFYLNESKLELEKKGEIETYHIQPLNALLLLKNDYIVINSIDSKKLPFISDGFTQFFLPSDISSNEEEEISEKKEKDYNLKLKDIKKEVNEILKDKNKLKEVSKVLFERVNNNKTEGIDIDNFREAGMIICEKYCIDKNAMEGNINYLFDELKDKTIGKIKFEKFIYFYELVLEGILNNDVE